MFCWLCLALLAPAQEVQAAPPVPTPPNIWTVPRRWKLRPYFPRPGVNVIPKNLLASPSKVCAIPLVRVPLPTGSPDQMPVKRPSRSVDPKFAVPPPAPPCDDGR